MAMQNDGPHSPPNWTRLWTRKLSPSYLILNPNNLAEIRHTLKVRLGQLGRLVMRLLQKAKELPSAKRAFTIGLGKICYNGA